MKKTLLIIITLHISITEYSQTFRNNKLTGIVISNVNSIDQYAFGDNKLTSFTIANSITSINC